MANTFPLFDIRARGFLGTFSLRRTRHRLGPAAVALFLCALLWATAKQRRLEPGDPWHPVVWSRRSLEACAHAECDQIPLSKGTRDHLRIVVDTFPPPHAGMSVLSRMRHAHCALVGGAPLGEDADIEAQGRAIDATDFVIRLNIREPGILRAEGVNLTLGQRTDALFMQRFALQSYESYMEGGNGASASTLEGVRHAARRKKAAEALRAKNLLVLFRTSCPTIEVTCSRAWSALAGSSILRWPRMLFLSPEMETLTVELLSAGKKYNARAHVASTGIVAFVAALKLCDRLSLFAFNGTTTGDLNYANATVSQKHSILTERYVLRSVSNCIMLPQFCGKVKIVS